MNTRFPLWLHLSGAVSALAALGGAATVYLFPDAETAALFPVGVMGVFATSRIASDRFSNRK